MAKCLAYGRRYGMDVSDKMLDGVGQKVAEVNLGNVKFMKCGPTELPVCEEPMGGVVLAFVSHPVEGRWRIAEAPELVRYPGMVSDGSGVWAIPRVSNRVPRDGISCLRNANHVSQARDLNGQQYMAGFRKGP